MSWMCVIASRFYGRNAKILHFLDCKIIWVHILVKNWYVGTDIVAKSLCLCIAHFDIHVLIQQDVLQFKVTVDNTILKERREH